MSSVMTVKILSELACATFVSVEVDESPDISKQEQISLVFRYISQFQVFERFIEFVECSSDRDAEVIARIVISKVEQYKVGSKLVAQTYNGASVLAGNTAGVYVRFREKHNEALFLHCFAGVDPAKN